MLNFIGNCRTIHRIVLNQRSCYITSSRGFSQSFWSCWPPTICTPPHSLPLTSSLITLLLAHSALATQASLLFLSPTKPLPTQGMDRSSLRSTCALLPRLQGLAFKIIVAPFPAWFYTERIFFKAFQYFLWVPIRVHGEKPLRVYTPSISAASQGLHIPSLAPRPPPIYQPESHQFYHNEGNARILPGFAGRYQSLLRFGVTWLSCNQALQWPGENIWTCSLTCFLIVSL